MLMSTADAERIYGIPARTIRRWHAEERICDPVIREGRSYWNVEEIDQMARQRHGRKRLPKMGEIAR